MSSWYVSICALLSHIVYLLAIPLRVVISPSEKQLPARLNMQIIERLQIHVAPAVFTPRAVYDGRKNLYAARELPFGETGTHEVRTIPHVFFVHSLMLVQFAFTLSEPSSEPARGEGEVARGPKQYKVKLTHVATINPEVLARFLVGKQSHDNMVLTAITALNVVIRMEPSLKYPFDTFSPASSIRTTANDNLDTDLASSGSLTTSSVH